MGLAPIKKVAIVIPKNTIPQVVEKSWATVTCNGQRKARVTQSIKPEATPVNTRKCVTNVNKSSPIASADTTLFIRLLQDHEWRKLSPAGIWEVIVIKLAI